jgi:Nuclease-related domain
MGKCLAPSETPGASAAVEGRRAHRGAVRRRLVSAALILAALVLALAGMATGHRWWLVGSASVAALSWYVRPDPDPDRWLRGSEGEVATAKLLSRLPRRFIVLHDRHAPGSRGNLDHIVVGPSGVWVVDSKVRHARARIHRGQVWAGDYPVDLGPVSRQAARVEAALGTPVAAVVAIHGAGLRRRGKDIAGVLVLPARRVARRLRRGRGRRLSHARVIDLASAADRLFPRR